MARTLFCLLLLGISNRVGFGQRWWPDEHSSGPFQYHADFQLKPFYPLLKSVSELQHDVPNSLDIGEIEEPIHVFLFEQKATYRAYVKKYFPTVPHRPALFVKQRGPGMVFAHLNRDIALDLRHETTHAVLHSILPMVPLWLDEGLGEYFEMPGKTRSQSHPHARSIKSEARRGRVPNIESLEQLGDIQEMKSQYYRDAWAWTHFMLHGPSEARETLLAYVSDIKALVPPGQLSQRLRRKIPRLERAFLDHFRNWPLR